MIKLPIPDALLEQHVAVLGKTGSGKSSAMRVLIEVCLLDENKPFIGIDPKGDWWGLKSSSSGKRAGYPIVIFGGLHADVPLNARAGSHVAELLATGNRPAIVDLSQMLMGERARFFIDFAESFFRHTRGKRWLMIDEVHNFAPKGKIFDPDAGKMLHWANKIASEGRGKGIQLLVASQRPQKVHNDMLDSCETLIAMRSVHPRAREAIKEWVDGAGQPEAANVVLSSLAKMPRGTGWVWSPEINFGPQQVEFPMFRTYDSFKPQLHDSGKRLQGWASVDLKEVREKLGEVVKEAEANDPRVLKLEIAELKKKVDTAYKDGYNTGKGHTEARGASKAELNAEHDRGTREGRADLAHSLINEFSKIEKTVGDTIIRLREISNAPKPKKAPRPEQKAILPLPMNPPSRALMDPGEEMKSLPRAILTALAQHPAGLSKSQILVHTGYRASGDVSSCFADLANKEWVEKLLGGNLRITPAGAKALGTYEPLPLGDELRESLLSGGNGKLSRLEKALLGSICKAYPSPIAKGAVLEETGYKASGDVSSAFAKLVALGYAAKESHGQLKAAQELFS